jgi:hypothetical protein
VKKLGNKSIMRIPRVRRRMCQELLNMNFKYEYVIKILSQE